ncbi:MAG TPA: 4Fe-4S dicluster domain-containing protein [Coriobacteriia bacterium]|nr:4Fe-4S dicluster domain-containing protein [Coriobacteriia bacterium]
MADTVMAIFQDADKCMRCNGCVVACKREWDMKSETIGVMKVAYDQRLAIKSQKRVDMGPFVRFTCWHCPDPPCAAKCPYDAMIKQENGAVSVDETKCQPTLCKVNGQYPCAVGCQRGGYPKIGMGRFGQESPKANKCTLCYGRAGSDAQLGDIPNALPSTATAAEIAAVPEKAHQPACVSSCPAKAMKWDTQENIIAYLNTPANGYILANGTRNWIGNGSMFWGSKKTLLAPPKADPLVEDHMAPLAGDLTSSTLKVALPTLVVGGLVALSARRARIEEDSAITKEV